MKTISLSSSGSAFNDLTTSYQASSFKDSYYLSHYCTWKGIKLPTWRILHLNHNSFQIRAYTGSQYDLVQVTSLGSTLSSWAWTSSISTSFASVGPYPSSSVCSFAFHILVWVMTKALHSQSFHIKHFNVLLHAFTSQYFYMCMYLYTFWIISLLSNLMESRNLWFLAFYFSHGICHSVEQIVRNL